MRRSSASTAAASSASGPRIARVALVDRRLERGRADVPGEDARVRVVEQRRLDAPAEQLLGLAHEVLVEPVLARDEHGEPVPAPPGAAPLLAQRRDRAREADGDHRVEQADVDPELERVRRGHAEQVARRRAAARSRAAAPACSRRGRARARESSPSRSAVKRWISSAALRLFANVSVRRPRSTSPACSFAASASGERAQAELLVEQRRVPEHDRALGPRRRVVADRRHRHAEQLAPSSPGFEIVADASRNSGSAP